MEFNMYSLIKIKTKTMSLRSGLHDNSSSTIVRHLFVCLSLTCILIKMFILKATFKKNNNNNNYTNRFHWKLLQLKPQFFLNPLLILELVWT